MRHEVHKHDAGQRFDRYLRKLLPRATLAHVFKLVRTGRARVNGAKVKGSQRLEVGDIVELQGDAAQLEERVSRAPARAGELSIVHEDEDLLVVDKPRGLAVHGGTGVGSDHLLARVLAYLGEGTARTFQPAPAHRIDRGTSGLVLFGKTADGLRRAQAAWREGAVTKRYVAIVDGVLEDTTGRIVSTLAREDAPEGPKVRAAPRGQRAETEWRRLSTGAAHSLVELVILTGRTHQIRAQMAELGHPLVGDERYGGSRVGGIEPGFWLHAAGLEVLGHAWSAAIPGAFARVCSKLRLSFDAQQG